MDSFFPNLYLHLCARANEYTSHILLTCFSFLSGSQQVFSQHYLPKSCSFICHKFASFSVVGENHCITNCYIAITLSLLIISFENFHIPFMCAQMTFSTASRILIFKFRILDSLSNGTQVFAIRLKL